MSSSSFHVLIIGGGIGGLCLAHRLLASKVSVAVYERNPISTWPEGYRIHINPVGSKALHECLPPLLWEAFVTIAGKAPAGLGFLTEQMEELLVIAEEFMANKSNNPIEAHYPVNRIALRHILMAGLEEVIHFDKRFERYEQGVNGDVTAFFTDGTSATGKVLVAADGANSKVRRQYLPKAQRVETGAVGVAGKLLLNDVTRGWLPPQLLARMNLMMAPSRYTLFNAAFDHRRPSAESQRRICKKAKAANLDPAMLIDNGQDYILWGFIAPADAYPSSAHSLDARSLQRLVGQMIKTWHPDLRRLIADSDPDSISLNPFKSSLPIAAWVSTNVTLLGDAIHNMPPVGGLGGNLALRDASLLACKLTAVDHEELPLLSAIQAYEAEMQECGFAAVRAAMKNTEQAISSNRFARLAARAWFRLCNVVPPLKRDFEESWTKPMRTP